jgi:hypothetical protein
LDEASEPVVKSKTEIKLRLDVDYAYPSRQKSFVCTILGIRGGKDYLRNPKIIAKMINESNKQVKAYWFFTPTTIPDEEMLDLMNEERHEVALHIINHPHEELQNLEQATKRKVNYYTVHGTQRLFARWMWGRNLRTARLDVPPDFPLTPFYTFYTESVDVWSYKLPPEQVLQKTEASIAKGDFLHFHPEWLFQRGTINRRGPYYETLKRILDVDDDLKSLTIRKKNFFKLAQNSGEYKENFVPSTSFLAKLADRGIDVFTFIERKWCCPIPEPDTSWTKVDDNLALQRITTYADWLALVGKKTRNMIRKAEKSRLKTQIVEPSEKLAKGIWRIYNETPIRQERAFSHYGISLKKVMNYVLTAQNSSFIGSFLDGELVGFIQLSYGDNLGIIEQILSFQKHSDKAINNAILAKAIEACANRHVEWLMYARMGNHPSLDKFKENNGFSKFILPRYYIALTTKGRIAIRLGLHRDLKDSLPDSLKKPLFPIFNWISRNKLRLRHSSPAQVSEAPENND